MGPELRVSVAGRVGPELRVVRADRMGPEPRVTFIGASNVAQVPLRPLVAVTDLRLSIMRCECQSVIGQSMRSMGMIDVPPGL
jgi:hypothetical protein